MLPLLLLGWSIYRLTVSEAGRKTLEHAARLRAGAFDHLRNVECCVAPDLPDEAQTQNAGRDRDASTR
jgi:hypothetical protein